MSEVDQPHLLTLFIPLSYLMIGVPLEASDRKSAKIFFENPPVHNQKIYLNPNLQITALTQEIPKVWRNLMLLVLHTKYRGSQGVAEGCWGVAEGRSGSQRVAWV